MSFHKALADHLASKLDDQLTDWANEMGWATGHADTLPELIAALKSESIELRDTIHRKNFEALAEANQRVAELEGEVERLRADSEENP